MPNESLLQCYNRGCGQKYDPNNNKDDSCRHHPGEPVFHDAYKGWACCNKKCTDFTEFLNIKGCAISMHSNIKPPEPEKPKSKDVPDVIESPKPVITDRLKRPPLDTALVTKKPELAPSLKQVVTEQKSINQSTPTSDEIIIGTTCKNSGCATTYGGPESNESACVYHPGIPIFHEGLKYWSCCQRKTTDFNAFLGQVGCERGNHLWKKDDSDKKSVQCRWDFHQTASFVVVSIYAKEYCPKRSVVQLNPVRLFAELVFPLQSDATFTLDVELKGIIDVEASHVTYFGTKVEIKLKTVEIERWTKLGQIIESKDQKDNRTKPTVIATDTIRSRVEAVDLSDL